MTSHVSPYLIGIAGGSCSGKTWLAGQLGQVFGEQTAFLSLDEFYRDRSQLSPSRRESLNFDHPRAIDWPLFQRTLQDCAAAKSVGVPRYDFTTHCRLPGTRYLEPHPLLLVEGLWVLLRPEVRRFFTLSIFIDCCEKTRLQRRLKRDTAERGRTRASIQQQFRETVAPMHNEFVAPQARWADLVLSEPISHIEVEAIAEKIWCLLTARSGPAPCWAAASQRVDWRNQLLEFHT